MSLKTRDKADLATPSIKSKETDKISILSSVLGSRLSPVAIHGKRSTQVRESDQLSYPVQSGSFVGHRP